MRKLVSFGLLLFIAFSVLTGCGGNSAAESADEGGSSGETEVVGTREDESSDAPIDTGIPLVTKDITVNYGDQTDFLFYPIIEKFGWFEQVFADNNITINPITFKNGAEMLESYTSDQVDIGILGTQPSVSGRANNVDVKIIAAFDDQSLATVIGTNEDSDIQSIDDIKGKTIGVPIGTSWYGFLLWELNTNNIAVEDVEIVNIDWQSSPTALEQGEIDVAVSTQQTFNSVAESDGIEFRILDDASDSGTQNCVVLARNSFAAEYPDVTESILAIIQKACDYINENQDEALKIISDYYGSSESSTKMAIETNQFGLYGGDGLKKDISAYIDFMYENDLITKKVEVDDLVDYQYLDETGILK